MFCGFMHKDVFVAFQDVTKEKKTKTTAQHHSFQVFSVQPSNERSVNGSN